jgi:hypothetical protein
MQSTLWVEDNPTFLERSEWIGKQSDLVRVLDSATFAFSYEDASRLISNSYARFILDADFPEENEPWRTQRLNVFLAERRAGKDVACPYQGCGDAGYENFVPFYKEFEQIMRGKTVVFSVSQEAAWFAFRLRLPFYTKASHDVRELVRGEFVHDGREGYFRRAGGMPAPISLDEFNRDLEAWEVGDTKALFDRYLI